MTRGRAVALVGGAVFLVACATTKDYQKETAAFIESATVAQQYGITFTGAVCERPKTVQVGTEYACTASGSDGAAYRFVVRISADKEYSVNPPVKIG